MHLQTLRIIRIAGIEIACAVHSRVPEMERAIRNAAGRNIDTTSVLQVVFGPEKHDDVPKARKKAKKNVDPFSDEPAICASNLSRIRYVYDVKVLLNAFITKRIATATTKVRVKNGTCSRFGARTP